MKLFKTCITVLVVFLLAGLSYADTVASPKKLAYLVSDLRIPFWDIMSRGIVHKANDLGYDVTLYSAQNDAKAELQNTVKALQGKVDGIIVSPTNSSTCVTILKLAQQAGIPVVISDIGTDGGEYVSYISSNNKGGAYKLGKLLAEEMHKRQLQKATVGIIAIPQKRANGQARTAGFMQALKEAGISSADMRQQVTFSYEETYNFSKELILHNPQLRALWLQGSDRYQGALDAINDAGKAGDILLLTFDAEPVFLDLIPKGSIIGAGMQQPFLMGEIAVQTLHDHLQGKTVNKDKQLNVLAVSSSNISSLLPQIRRNVLGLIK